MPFALALALGCNSTGPADALTGKIVFVALVDLTWQVFVVSADGSQPDQLTRSPGSKHSPAWSRDGSRMAYALETGDGQVPLFVAHADGSAPTRVTPGPLDYYTAPAWSPDGSRLALAGFASGPIRLINVDGTGLVTVPGTEQLSAGDPAWSPDGTQLAFWAVLGGNFEIMSINLDGSNLVNLTNTPGAEGGPRWSPDGSQIAYDRSDGDGLVNVFVMTADGTGQRRLTDFPRGSLAGAPAWSPDGTHLAFAGPDGIYVMRADGSGQARLVSLRTAASPDWR